MRAQIIPKKDDGRGKLWRTHVYMVRPPGAERRHPFDEKEVARIRVVGPEDISGGGKLLLENFPGPSSDWGDNQDIDDRFGDQSRDGRAADVFETQARRGISEQSANCFHFGGESLWPSGVVIGKLDDIGLGIAPALAVEADSVVCHLIERRRRMPRFDFAHPQVRRFVLLGSAAEDHR